MFQLQVIPGAGKAFRGRLLPGLGVTTDDRSLSNKGADKSGFRGINVRVNLAMARKEGSPLRAPNITLVRTQVG